MTGVRLDGNAAAWWNHAEGHYDRGHQPSVGAILVFKPYGGMHVGHVAVVSRVVSPHEVLVDQANWVRGRVTKAMSVVDASPLNDWTSVKVQYAGTHGRANPTYGFIYPKVVPASFGETIVESQPDRPHDRHHADRVADKAKHPKDKNKPAQVAAKQPDPAKAAKQSDPAKTAETKTAEAKAAKTKPVAHLAQNAPAQPKPAPHPAQNAPAQPKLAPAETQLANVY